MQWISDVLTGSNFVTTFVNVYVVELVVDLLVAGNRYMQGTLPVNRRFVPFFVAVSGPLNTLVLLS